MRKSFVTGIDVGTYHVKVVIAEPGEAGAPPRIIGTGMAKSSGLRHGYIINSGDVSASIEAALGQAQSESGVTVKEATISFGGVGLEELRSRGKALIARAGSEVADTDIDEALRSAQSSAGEKLRNKKVLHKIPLKYTLDEQEVLGSPIGMLGSELVVDVLFITALEQHLHDLILAVEDAGVAVLDAVAAPIAASLVTVNKTQKMAGCVLANIGAETLSLVVFEDNTPISIKVLPVGSSSITNDIALGFKIPLIEAEQLKLGAVTNTDYSKKRYDDIIAARLKDTFKLVEAHLKDIGKSGLLPAGVILTGGGSGILGIDDFAKSALKLPTELFSMHTRSQALKDGSWAVAYGLCILASSSSTRERLFTTRQSRGGNIMGWLKRFLP